MTRSDAWAIVLAGGDGLRLRGLTADSLGTTVPKQFCSLDGGLSLLEMAMARAERLVPSERILVSVNAAHQRWWRDDLQMVPDVNIVSQPANRGTLAGLLLPLLEITARDPLARVVVVPSDHFARDEIAIETAARSALADLERHPDAVVVLGMEPEILDSELGWILPETGSADDPRRVARFVEKPDRDEARRLLQAGGLVNSFILTATIGRLLELCRLAEPVQFWSLRVARWRSSPGTGDRLAEAYSQIPSADFSRDVLQRAAGSMLVRSVPPCGWNDLGTPDRVARWAGGYRGVGHAVRRNGAIRPVLANAVAERVATPAAG